MVVQAVLLSEIAYKFGCGGGRSTVQRIQYKEVSSERGTEPRKSISTKANIAETSTIARKWLPKISSGSTGIAVDYQVIYDYAVDALLQQGRPFHHIPSMIGCYASTRSFPASLSAVAGVVSSPARHTRLRLFYDIVWVVWGPSQPWGPSLMVSA